MYFTMRVFHTGYHTVVCHTHLCNVSTNYCLVYRSFVCISHNPVNLIKSVFCDKIRFISYHPLSTSHETHSFNKPLYICLSSFEIRVRLLLLISGTFIKKKKQKKTRFLILIISKTNTFPLDSVVLFSSSFRCLLPYFMRFTFPSLDSSSPLPSATRFLLIFVGVLFCLCSDTTLRLINVKTVFPLIFAWRFESYLCIA